MDASDIIRLPDPREHVRLELREVVHELHERPHLLVRARLTGWHFPHRAEEPFLLVGDVVSRLVRIAPDGLTADAFFDRPLPHVHIVSFGYGRTIAWDFALHVDMERVERLDRARLPEGVVHVLREERRAR
jgi:hypothetical protein